MNHADVSMQNDRVKRNKKRLPHLYRRVHRLKLYYYKARSEQNRRETTKAYKR